MSSNRTSPLIRSLATCLAAIGVAAGTLAQPAGSPTGRPATPAGVQIPIQPPAPEPLININFPGGPVSAYCESVRDAASPNVVNIILNEGVGDVTLPPILLKQVTVDVAMKLLSMTGRPDTGTTIRMERLDDQGASAYVLRSGNFSKTIYPSSRETRVHSLRSIVEPPPGMPNSSDVALPVDTVMAALTAAAGADAQGPEGPPELMLHRESLMLVCRGTRSQQDLIGSVLDELKNDMGNRRSMLARRMEVSDKARIDRITSEAEVKQAQAGVAKASADYQEALHTLDLIQKRVDSGLSPQTDLSRAQSAFNSAQSNLDAAKNQYESAKSRAAVLAERQEAMAAPPASEQLTVVVYNADDFAPFKNDILTVTSDLLGHGGGNAQWTNNSLVVSAGADQQRAIKAFLLTLRRVKANDPKLAPPDDVTTPGLGDASGK